MSDILTTVVDPSVAVGDTEFIVTYIEVERHTGTTASYAKVKGIVDDPEAIELGQTVEVSVNDEIMFRGDVNKAVQNEEGIVTVEAYDVIKKLHNQRVTLATEVGQVATGVARDLLEDSTIDDFFVDIAANFPGDQRRSLYEYGSGKSGERLSSVLDDLTKKLGGVMWATKDNQIRIEPYPEHQAYELQYIIELLAGSESISEKNVLVKGGSPTSDLGQAAAHFKRQIDISSSGELPNPGEEDAPEKPQKILRDDNVGTQEEADTMAMSLAREEAKQATPSSAKVVGNGSIELFDQIEIPDTEYVYNTGVDPARVPGNGTATSNLYQVKSITHKINAQDGFVTTIDVSPAMQNVLNDLSGPAGLIARELTAVIDGRASNAEPLGITTGFLDNTNR